MKIRIELYCPNCQSAKVVKNGKKPNGKQNYLCKNEGCGRQFIGDHNLTYKGCHSNINRKIILMLVRGVGIRDISKIEEVSIGKAYTVAIEGNNCKLRNRIKRAFRKTCCFSKKQINHLKTLAFFYITYGYI